MGEVYLNDAILFKCKFGATFRGCSSVNTLIKGKKALNSSVLVQNIDAAPVLCKDLPPLPNGQQQPCPCYLAMKAPVPVNWISASKIKINGASALTNKSYFSCPIQNRVEPSSFDKINVNNSINKAYDNISFDSRYKKHAAAANKNLAAKSSREEVNNASLNNSDSENLAESFEENYKYALCDYKNCGKVKVCKYIKTPNSIEGYGPYDGNSTFLKENMKKNANVSYEKETNEITSILSPLGENYTVQHHHIIPSKQCYNKVSELVKLGNFYEYNINNANNGICLPSGGGYGKPNALDENISISFRAMNKTSKQWHIGGHSMSLLINTLHQIQPFVEDVLCENATAAITGYDQSVTEKLRQFLSLNKNNYLDTCRVEDYDRQKKDFCSKMDRISLWIRKKLINYNENPKNHQWYYISKMSLYYAFEDLLRDYKEKIFN